MSGRLLIIDDDECLVRAYTEHFSDLGHQVDSAHELEEAQTLLAYFPYVVVITDLRLSKLGFDGLDIVKHVRDRSLPTRIIVLTGYGWPELKAEARAQGVDAFVQKPVRLAQVARTVASFTGVEA